MIAQTDTRAKRRQLEREIKARFGKNSAQHIINALLWKIVAGRGGEITFRADELKQVPPAAGVKVQLNTTDNTLILKAVLRPGLFIPDNNGLIV